MVLGLLRMKYDGIESMLYAVVVTPDLGSSDFAIPPICYTAALKPILQMIILCVISFIPSDMVELFLRVLEAV